MKSKKKTLTNVLTLLMVALLVLIPYNGGFDVQAASASGVGVKDIGELKRAVENDVHEIYLLNDIETTEIIEIYSGKNVTLDLNGKTLKKNGSRSLIKVESGGSLTICDSGEEGTITSEMATPATHGAVHVAGGTCTLEGGYIRGNKARQGAGVAVTNGGTFTMSGGSIENNKVYRQTAQSLDTGVGGGVYVENATFVMNGGVIRGNGNGADNRNNDGGGVYVAKGGTFTMNGGAVGDSVSGSPTQNGNNADGRGGGVFVSDGGTFDFKGGVVQFNIGQDAASGVFISEGAAFHMTDGAQIYYNVATGKGGGLYVEKNATCVLEGGKISRNEAATAGGGIYIAEGGNVTISSVDISNNSGPTGGGVMISSGAALKMVGGSITDNQSSVDSLSGGGVMVNGTLQLSGAAVIKNNHQGESVTSNVVLSSGKKIEFTSALTNGADIGVRTADRGDSVGISIGYSTTNAKINPTKYIKSDEAVDNAAGDNSAKMYYVQKGTGNDASDNEVYLVLTEHRHSMVKHEAVDATCSHTGAVEYYECSECHRYYEEEAGLTELDTNELVTEKNPYRHEETERVEDLSKKVDATCVTSGRNTINIVCKSCGTVVAKTVNIVPKLGHEWEAITDTDTGRNGWRCTRCGETVWNEKPGCVHNKVAVERIEPTCTKSGLEAHARCSECGALYADTEPASPALGINEIEDLEIPALGHDESDYVVDEATRVGATCETSGYHEEYKYCEREGCGEELDRQTVTDEAPLGHKWSDFVLDTAKGCMMVRTCERCGKTEEDGPYHELVDVDVLEPTCTKNGHKAYTACINCKNIYSKSESGEYTVIGYESLVTPALGHSFGEWSVGTEPTVDAKGREVRSCVRCGNEEFRYMDKVTYEFTKGDGSSWTNGTSTTLDFTVKRSYKDEETFENWFTGQIKIDDTLVDASDYTASKGSVNISLKPSILNKLSIGEHKLTIVFKDTELTAKFTIVRESGKTNKSPATGDNTPVKLCFADMVMALFMMAVITMIYIKKTED